MELCESLQAEFCSRIDSSLLAAIISDYAVQDDGTLAVHQVETIREKLNFLANHSYPEDELEEAEASVYSFSNMSTTSPTTPELCDSTTATSSGSDTSSSQHSSNSPLGFLAEAFSDVPIERLKRLLRDASEETLEVDIEKMVEVILNLEHIRELTERGLDDLEPSSPPSPSEDWETVVRTKPKQTPKLSTPSKKKVKGHTFKLVDVRQTQHALPSPAKQKGMPERGVARDAGVTPWEHILSLSTHLATLLPPASESHFVSSFHSPAYATPADALRAALATLPSTSSSIKHRINQSQQGAESNPLFAIIDLLQASPEFAALDAEQRSTLWEDARLALAATCNKPDDALSIIWILQDLEQSGSSVGIYHLPPPPSNSDTAPMTRVKLPTGPPPLQPPPTSKRKATSSLSSPTTPTQPPTPSKSAWKDVPVRSRANTHPLEDHIPAYKRKVRGAGNGLGKGGKGDEGELLRQDTGGGLVGARHSHFTRRMLQGQKERGELLRKAGLAWRGPGGGAAAMLYAQKAREVTERVRSEALEEARALIRARRAAGHDKRTIDLHGTCVQEAIVITSEILANEGCSRASPLRLITGRGTHSVGGVGVLKPAVRQALINNGWDVRVWDGGLVVQGRTR